jgi:hypothetical protein
MRDSVSLISCLLFSYQEIYVIVQIILMTLYLKIQKPPCYFFDQTVSVISSVKFDVLAATNIKTAVYWDVAPSSHYTSTDQKLIISRRHYILQSVQCHHVPHTLSPVIEQHIYDSDSVYN